MSPCGKKKNTGEKIVEDALKFMHRQQSLETWQNSFVFENVRNIYSELHQHRLLLTEQTEIKVVTPFEWNKDLADERFNRAVLGLRLGLENEQFHQEVERFVANYEKQKQEIAEFFGIEQSQVAEFLGYEEPKELLEQARQIISQNNPTVLHDMNGLPEKEKNMQNIEERYYAKFPNATRSEKFAELAKEQGKTDEEIKNALTDIFDEHFRGEQWEDKFDNGFVVDIPTNLDWESEKATFVPVIMPLEKVKSEMCFTLSNDLSGDLSRYLSDYKESGALVNLEYAITAYEEYRQKTADFFGIEQSQVAEFLGYTEPKELLEQARQIISGSPEQTVEVKQDAFSQSEKENTMNETEKQALAQAFKNLELPDRKYVVKGSLVEFQDRPESEIIAALGWDEFATAVKDYVNSQSDENTEKLRNAYLVYPFYNELANKGIRDDSTLRNQYAEVIESKFSSFNERRTAALFILQSMWRGRGNSTDITRSYNIDAMTAYIARGKELRSGWRLENRVNEYFLTKNSIFTHKNLREMGLDNNSNLAPYAPELLQEMVKIEEQHRVFSQWQNQNSEGGWYNRGAENIIDFKQIPAAVQKDLILMVSDRYSSKRDIFGVYDNPVASMQHGLAVRSEVQHNLEMLIEQQEKEWQRYQKMGLGVPVPQKDAITQQINAYKETLEQVKNAPAVAFVPEKLFLVGETKPDWRTGEVQRYKTTEINTKTGEIAFVNDPNNPNPNPFGDMTEQARQYLSANNNFALAALGVTTRKMPENMKFDMIGQTEKDNQMSTLFEFNNGYSVIISNELSDYLANRTDFVGEAALYHQDNNTVVAELNYYEDDDEYSGEIVLFDKEKGYTNLDERIEYNVDIANPNWKENLARAMVDFGISKESITKLNANKEFGQPEIVEVKTEHDFYELLKSVKTSSENNVEKPRLGDEIITLTNGKSFAPVISAYADERLKTADFVTATRTLGERFPLNYDDYLKFENHQSKANFFYCLDTNEVVIFAENPSKEQSIFNIENTEFYGLKDLVQELKQEMSVQMETQRIEQQRIEKREQVFNMITASGVMNTAWNGDETHGTESVLDTPFINKSLYYQDGELVYKDANYQHYETPDIFKISKQDFERHSPQAIALAVMKGVEEYKKMYRPEKAPEQLPTKRNDLQHTVNVGLQQYDNMFSPEIQKTHRLDILASQEKHRSQSVSGSPKEQTAISSPENAVKFDDFGVSESVPFAEKIFHYMQLKEQINELDKRIDLNADALIYFKETNQADRVESLQDDLQRDRAKLSELSQEKNQMDKADNRLWQTADYIERQTAEKLTLERVQEILSGSPKQVAEVKQDAFGTPETPKTLSLQEQALKDGKDLSAAEIKVRDSKWELAKQPNNAERKTAYEQAQAELTALKSEIKERVQAAMDKGVPYIARYSEVPREPFNNAKAPIEFAITPKGELTEVIGTTDTPHNLVPSNAGQGAVLNTEQRSSPQRIAEALREHYQKSGILSQLDAINAVGGDKVFSEQEIKQTLNRALKDYHPSSIRGALESPRMKDEWLQVVIDKHPKAEIKQAAQRVLEQRQGNQPLEQSSGFSSPTVSGSSNPQAENQHSLKDDELLKQLCKPDFVLRKAALNDPEISVNLLKRVIDNHKCPQTRNVAKAVLEQRQGGGVGMSQPQSNTRSIAGATPKAAAPKPKASMSM